MRIQPKPNQPNNQITATSQEEEQKNESSSSKRFFGGATFRAQICLDSLYYVLFKDWRLVKMLFFRSKLLNENKSEVAPDIKCKSHFFFHLSQLSLRNLLHRLIISFWCTNLVFIFIILVFFITLFLFYTFSFMFKVIVHLCLFSSPACPSQPRSWKRFFETVSRTDVNRPLLYMCICIWLNCLRLRSPFSQLYIDTM